MSHANGENSIHGFEADVIGIMAEDADHTHNIEELIRTIIVRRGGQVAAPECRAGSAEAIRYALRKLITKGLIAVDHRESGAMALVHFQARPQAVAAA